jgi:hypothetical protein
VEDALVKRVIFVLLAITIVTSASGELVESAQAKYSGGSGTADNPYEIGSAADLLALAADTNDYNKYFVLTADIDLNPNLPGGQVFTTAVIAPDADNSNYTFQGTAFIGDFNGNNHTITNLTINTSGAGNDFLGLFGKIDSGGQIINIGLENVTITGGDNSFFLGGLVGWNSGNISNCLSTGTVNSGDNSGALGGLAGYNKGTISNCFSTGDVRGGDNSEYLGGLVGYNSLSIISNCYSTSVITGGDNSNSLGGLVGLSYGNVTDCYSTGKVTGGDNSEYLGGLVGLSYGDVSNCYSIGTVTGGSGSSILGGLVGFNNSAGTISVCCSTGAVTGAAPLGGLVGRNENGTISNCYSSGNVRESLNTPGIGGVVGDSNHGDISNCYSSGIITIGTSKYSGWLGLDRGGTAVSHCYYLFNKGSSAIGYSSGSLTAAQTKQQASFVGWDFAGETANGTSDIWWIAEGAGYPKLVWRLDVAKCTVTAGSADSDKISLSGQMGATSDDFVVGSNVKVTVSSSDIVNPCVLNFPINGRTFKNGKYNYSGTDSGVKKSFTYNVKTHKFALAASNADLSGLGCPVTANIEIGDCNATAELDETIVNGAKPIPINLMTGVKNALRVDFKPKRNQLLVTGGFAVANTDVNMTNRVSQGLVVTLGSQTFTIPANKLVAGSGKFTCSKAELTEGGVATASFDFNKCSFTLMIKNVGITSSGDTNLRIEFAGFSESVPVTLPYFLNGREW